VKSLAKVVLMALGLLALGYVLHTLSLVRPASPAVYTQRGNEISLEDLLRPVRINFFAPWCPPCRREIPFLLSHVRELNLVFVGVQDTRNNVFAFAERNGIPENRVYYGGYGGPVKYYHVQALPTTLVLCPGKDPQAVLGEITEERLPLLSCPRENPRRDHRGLGATSRGGS
jgi:thiol-disulfide isomerase/thioredoxin